MNEFDKTTKKRNEKLPEIKASDYNHPVVKASDYPVMHDLDHNHPVVKVSDHPVVHDYDHNHPVVNDLDHPVVNDLDFYDPEVDDLDLNDQKLKDREVKAFDRRDQKIKDKEGNNISKDVIEAVRKHLERTRHESVHGVYRPSGTPQPTHVISQFNEVVKTPVEDGLDGADPEANGGDVDDYRDVQSEAVKIARKKQIRQRR